MSGYEKPKLNIIVGPWAKWAKSSTLLLDEVSRDEIETILREMGMGDEDVKKFASPSDSQAAPTSEAPTVTASP